MALFTVDEICRATGGTASNLGNAQQFTGVCTDTRKVKSGDVFIALVGETFDGHNFIEQAIRSGASGVIASHSDIAVPAHVTLIVVDDTLKALQDVACFHRKRFTIPIVGITGSNGKTTTKDMTAAVLGSKFNVLKTEANYNNEIGLPLTLLQLTNEHEVAVVEMGMRGLGQIRQLANIALPTIAVITNVGETHIELLGSIENIAAAKAELLEVIPESGLVILNGDDPYVQAMAQQVHSSVTLFGLEHGTLRGEEIATAAHSMNFQCCIGQEKIPMSIPTVGKHNVYNALAAIAVGVGLGMNFENISAGLSNFNASPMRLHIETIGEYVVINDAYNASPMSMSAAIDTLVEVAKERTVAVLGDMLELGDIAAVAHRQIGEKLAECNIDIVVTIGELARNIVAAAQEQGITKAISCANHAEAEKVLRELVQPGDTILIKGSRGMKMENMVKMFL